MTSHKWLRLITDQLVRRDCNSQKVQCICWGNYRSQSHSLAPPLSGDWNMQRSRANWLHSVQSVSLRPAVTFLGRCTSGNGVGQALRWGYTSTINHIPILDTLSTAMTSSNYITPWSFWFWGLVFLWSGIWQTGSIFYLYQYANTAMLYTLDSNN